MTGSYDKCDYTHKAKEAAEMPDGVPIKNGGIISSASMFSKIVASVVIAAIIGGVGFGLEVYGFMAQGPRFSSRDYLVGEIDQDRSIHAMYVPRDVYASDMARVQEALARIEKKLDRLTENKSPKSSE